MITLKVTTAEYELITRSLRIAAVELVDKHEEQAHEIFKLRGRCIEQSNEQFNNL